MESNWLFILSLVLLFFHGDKSINSHVINNIGFFGNLVSKLWRMVVTKVRSMFCMYGEIMICSIACFISYMMLLKNIWRLLMMFSDVLDLEELGRSHKHMHTWLRVYKKYYKPNIVWLMLWLLYGFSYD